MILSLYLFCTVADTLSCFLFPADQGWGQMTLCEGLTWSEAKGNKVLESSSWVWQWWIGWSSLMTQDGSGTAIAVDKSVFVFHAYLYSCFIYFHSLLFSNFSYVTLINYFLWITCVNKVIVLFVLRLNAVCFLWALEGVIVALSSAFFHSVGAKNRNPKRTFLNSLRLKKVFFFFFVCVCVCKV